MEEEGKLLLWWDTIGQVPIRIGIPEELAAREAKSALEQFVGFLADLADSYIAPMTLGQAHKMAREQQAQKVRQSHRLYPQHSSL
jgi:hypothetical protein